MSKIFHRNEIWFDLPDEIPQTIKEMIQYLEELGKKYGKNSQIDFDAGANNVSIFIKPSKKDFYDSQS